MGQFILKALKGELKGQSFPVKKSMVIGRGEGDIALNDPLVSNPHAEIQVYDNKKIMIEDLESKNHIFMNGQMIVKSILEEGSRFQIGDSEFQLCYEQTFEELMLGLMKKEAFKVKDKEKSLSYFPYEIELHFLEGLQKGTKYLLSYGPRILGRKSLDLPLLDKEAPDAAFEVFSEEGDVFFETESMEVYLNGDSVIEKRVLKQGDEIVVGKSRLQVHVKK